MQHKIIMHDTGLCGLSCMPPGDELRHACEWHLRLSVHAGFHYSLTRDGARRSRGGRRDGVRKDVTGHVVLERKEDGRYGTRKERGTGVWYSKGEG